MKILVREIYNQALSGGKSRIIFRSSDDFWEFVVMSAKVFTLLVVVKTFQVLQPGRSGCRAFARQAYMKNVFLQKIAYLSFIAKLPTDETNSRHTGKQSSLFFELIDGRKYVQIVEKLEDKSKSREIQENVDAFDGVTLYEEGKKSLKSANQLLDEL